MLKCYLMHVKRFYSRFELFKGTRVSHLTVSDIMRTLYVYEAADTLISADDSQRLLLKDAVVTVME